MTYFEDLSRYSYHDEIGRASLARNVGWLDASHEFQKEEPSQKLIDALWKYCFILVVPTRGLHDCELCASPSNVFAMHDAKLLLGSGEIRVFCPTGNVFAAPNLIYHYVRDHNYRPPEEFLQAVERGPRPHSQEYRQLLDGLRATWRENATVNDEPKQIIFVKNEEGVVVREEKGRG